MPSPPVHPTGGPCWKGRRVVAPRAVATLLAATLAIAAGACASSGRSAPSVPGGGDGLFVAGYQPWWAGDAWSPSDFGGLDRLYLFEIELQADGTLGDAHGWPEAWEPLLNDAGALGLSVVPVVTLYPESAVASLLADPASVARAAETISGIVEATPDVDGVHLDLEVFSPVPPEARRGYVELTRAVRTRIRAAGAPRIVSVFVPALDLPDAYDEVGLDAASDYLVVQGYDLHHRGDTRAGPVAGIRGWAPLDWETVLARFVELGVRRRDLLMGIPLYGYEWPVEGPSPGSPTRGPGVVVPLDAPPDVVPELPRALERAERHGTRRDPASASPWYAYQTDEGWWQGWTEDQRSIRAKLDFVKREELGGVAFFPLTYATPAIRELVRKLPR